MKVLLKSASATVAVVASVFAASAADLPSRTFTAPIFTPVPVYNWTGIYVGLNGGYAFGHQDPLALFSNDFQRFEYSADGWIGGVTGGAQIQSGRVVMGLEGDLDWTSLDGSGSGTVSRFGKVQGTATLSSSVSSISTFRTRIGYAQDNWLLYGTAGLALTDAKAEFLRTVGFACNNGVVPCKSKSDLHVGVALGAGIEYGLTQNLSAKVEYLWVGAGAVNTLKENIVRVGVNYRFGGN
jgi:outer membrane immunogenic protein